MLIFNTALDFPVAFAPKVHRKLTLHANRVQTHIQAIWLVILQRVQFNTDYSGVW